MKKVFIGVGHGGNDPGAVANGLKESNLNLRTALEVKSILVDHGVNVKLSREREENDDLAEEIRECNAFSPDLAVDMHTNSGGGDGFEVFYSRVGGTGKTLSLNIETEVKAIGQNSRGIKTKLNSSGSDYFGFIRSTNCPAIITEMAFIDNKNDIKDFDEEYELKRYSLAVAKGILKTLGISYKGTIEVEKERYNMCLFSENWYLWKNPDVRKAIDGVNLKSGYHHYLKHGKEEGRSPLPPIPKNYCEGDYLDLNTDIKKVVPGVFTSGLHHYLEHGFKESHRRVSKDEHQCDAEKRVKELEEKINKIKDIVK